MLPAVLALAVAIAPSAKEEEAPRIEALVIDAEGVDEAELRRGIELRLPERRLRKPGGKIAAKLFGYVQIRPGDGDLVLALILSDGRAYYRSVPTDPDLAPRELASALANLVTGIEEERVEPDAQDVPLPVLPEEDPPPEKIEKPPRSPSPPDPRVELGPYLGGAAILAIPPPGPAGLAAGGGSLGVDVRLRNGVTFGLGFRGAGLSSNDFGLARFRVSVGAGYVWRTGAFELVTLGALDVEPWLVLRSGERESLVGSADGNDAPAELLLGGHVRVAPGYRAVLRPRALALRIAPVLEIGGSAIPAGDGGIAQVRRREDDGADRELFRAGGFELAVGLEVGLWFGLGT